MSRVLQTTIRSTIGVFALLGLASHCLAQTTFLQPGSEEYHLLDRLETRTRKISSEFNSAQLPISRKAMVDYLSGLKLDANVGRFSGDKVDVFGLERAISISGEWYENASGESGFYPSKRPILNFFYKTPADLYQVETDNFFLAVNPVLYLKVGKELDGSRVVTNTRGLELRGRIADKIGFYTMLADNQESVPKYVQHWIDEHNGQFPGMHYSPLRGTSYDIFEASGYINVGFAKDHASLTFGYGKNQIGYGIRSLVYSNNAAPATFLKLSSHWNKFQYENLFLEQVPNNTLLQRRDGILPRKYAAIHTLNYTATPALSLGVFESSVLNQGDGIPLDVLIPVIGFQSLAKRIGNTQSSTAWGLQFKALPVADLQLYGQTFFQKVNFSGIGKGTWDNEYAFQFGLKYFNVATIKNLDGQIEANVVRPFTYQGESNTLTAYSHYNQPVAHPLGNNFYEFIGNLRYQPTNLLTLSGRLVYSKQGVDSGSAIAQGNGLFEQSSVRSFGNANAYPMLVGQQKTSVYANFNAAYELRPNLFLELGGTTMQSKVDDQAKQSAIILYGGLRLNIGRERFDYN